ncbi:MAG: EF-P lysine aminoacylase EpmA [Gammaproteobacteria bacterium]|nr:EF-P lysine aminoacylase EpmA [Gammaproteobacteria bacterium]
MRDRALDSDWRPGADLAALRARATLLADLRRHFADGGVLEVETPLACATAGTDPALQPLTARYRGPVYPDGTTLYLQTSPEFAMKRLLAAGSGPIYQICKAFRDGEAGRLHNPEFTILEWYRPGCDLPTLIDEVADVARLALGMPDLAARHNDYAALFAQHLDIDVFAADPESLRGYAVARHILGAEGMELDRDGWLDLLFSHLIQPALGADRLCFVTDYPASQAALARLNADGQTAARFELFYRGVELANGFHELSDADEQAARFEADNCARRAAGRPPIKVDRRVLAALQHGLPDCAGVAVGLDRLLMLRLGCRDIDAVMSFSLQRC